MPLTPRWVALGQRCLASELIEPFHLVVKVTFLISISYSCFQQRMCPEGGSFLKLSFGTVGRTTGTSDRLL